MAVLARSWVTLLALLSLRNTCHGSRDLLTFRSTEQGPTPRILETIDAADVPAAPGGNGTCAELELELRRVEVRSPLVGQPGTTVLVACHTSSGRVFYPITLGMEDADRLTSHSARFTLFTPAARLSCLEGVACHVTLIPVAGAAQTLIGWGVGSCWFMHYQFLQLSSTMWACQDARAGEYVLQCVNCEGDAGGDADADADGLGAEDRRGGVHPTIMIIMLSTGAVFVVAIALAVLAYVRAARRTTRLRARLSGLAAEPGEAAPKPVPMYQLELGREGGAVGVPPGHQGPTVVVSSEGSLLMLAKPEAVGPAQLVQESVGPAPPARAAAPPQPHR
ncbi:hypothetical protein ACKKBG_A06580 [Auxenochlorella protothecoides x Auxenochlorella symbiontica]